MPFKPGKSGNPKGKPKGAKCKDIKQVRAWINKIVSENQLVLEEDLKLLSPKDRVNAIMNLLEYCEPKLSRVELTNDEESGFTITLVNAARPNTDT